MSAYPAVPDNVFFPPKETRTTLWIKMTHATNATQRAMYKRKLARLDLEHKVCTHSANETDASHRRCATCHIRYHNLNHADGVSVWTNGHFANWYCNGCPLPSNVSQRDVMSLVGIDVHNFRVVSTQHGPHCIPDAPLDQLTVKLVEIRPVGASYSLPQQRVYTPAGMLCESCATPLGGKFVHSDHSNYCCGCVVAIQVNR